MADIKQKVIFEIGTVTGPGSLTDLKSAFDLIGSGVQTVQNLTAEVARQVKELDKFAAVYRRVQTDISGVDEVSAGLIDTLALMQDANKFTAAGMNLTREQFAAVAKAATSYAQATGITATDSMNRLTESITKGSTRALKELGIDIENSEDLLKAQAEAIEKVIQKSAGMTVEMDTNSQRVEALSNNWGTFKGLLWDSITGMQGARPEAISLASALDTLNKSINRVNNSMMEENIVLGVNSEEWRNYHERVRGEVLKAQHQRAQLTEQEISLQEELKNKYNLSTRTLEEFGKAQKKVIENQMTMIYGPTLEQLGTSEAALMNRPKKKKGGGKKKPPLLDTSVSPWESQMIAEQQFFGAMFDPGAPSQVDKLSTALDRFIQKMVDLGKSNLQLQEEIAAWNDPEFVARQIQGWTLSAQLQAAQIRAEIQAWNDPAFIAAQREKYFVEQNLMQIKKEKMLEIERDYLHAHKVSEMEMMLGLEQEYINASKKLWDSGLRGRLQQMNVFFSSMSGLMNTKYRVLFAIGKTAEVARAITSALLGANEARAALAGIPIVGPLLGEIAARSIQAQGFFNVKQIMDTKFGGSIPQASGSSISTGSAGSGGGVPSSGSGGGWQAPTAYAPNPNQQDRPVKVIIELGDNAMFFDAIVDSNDNASKNGRRAFREVA